MADRPEVASESEATDFDGRVEFNEEAEIDGVAEESEAGSETAPDSATASTESEAAAVEGNVPEELLGRIASVQCLVALNQERWSLALDTLVVSSGPDGFGRFGQELRQLLAAFTADPQGITVDRPRRVNLSGAVGGPTE